MHSSWLSSPLLSNYHNRQNSLIAGGVQRAERVVIKRRLIAARSFGPLPAAAGNTECTEHHILFVLADESTAANFDGDSSARITPIRQDLRSPV